MSLRTRLGLVSIAGFALAIGSAPVSATIYVQVPEALAARAADEIVLGDVVATTSAWERGRIVTRARVRVDAVLAGAAPPSIEVTVPGGSIDGIAMRVIGAPALAPGERVLLLLRVAGPRRHVVGLEAGKHAVMRDGAGHDRIAWAGPGGVRWVSLAEAASYLIAARGRP